jgi:uncharacterized membrane protein
MVKLRPVHFAMTLLPLLWMLATPAPLGPIWRAILSLPFLLFVPGYFSFRFIAGYERRFGWEIFVYSLGLSLVALMAIGFGVNEIGLYLHDPTPLQTTPLTLSVGITTAVLGLLASLRRPKLDIKWPKLNHLGAVGVGLLLPLLAIGGANTLNNGGSNWLALVALSGVAIFAVAIAWKARRDNWTYPYALFAMGLTILLGTSMRGWNITGHDVMQEFQVFQLTAGHSVWHMHFYQDAYNACLSITILPTVLQRLTGIADQYIFKFVVQLYFAAMAPIVYLSLRRYVPTVMAFLAGVVFITFPTFLTDMAMLNRQETAFICLGLAVLAMLDESLKRRTKSLLAFIFLGGMVASHYSTSYMAVGTLIIAAVIMYGYKTIVRLRKGRLAATKLGVPIFSTPIIIATLLVLIGWGTLATQTSNNIAATIGGVVTGLPKVVSSITQPNVTSHLNSAQLVSLDAATTQASRSLPNTAYYPLSVSQAIPTISLQEPVDQLTPAGSALHLPVNLIGSLYDALKQGYAKLIQVLILLGLGVVIFSRKARANLPIEYIVVGAASLAMIGLQVVLPSSLINYGLLRSIQQGLIFLAFPVVAASFWLLGRINVTKRLKHRVVALIFAAFFLVLSGVIPAITGGYKAALPVSNSGFYYEAYYTHQDEITADQWLLHNTPIGSRVYADEFSRRQMITYSGIFPQPTLIASAIPIDSYVYLSDSNTTFQNVPAYYQGTLVYYNLPTTFLESQKNLIYSTGTVQIYR